MICIYHSRDLDGYSSGAIIKHKHPEAKLIGYDYGLPFPWDQIPAGEKVIMVDVSIPMEDMEKLAKLSGDLKWIDHHKSAIDDFYNYFSPKFNFDKNALDFRNGGGLNIQDGNQNYIIKTRLQIGIAACEIAWMDMFGDVRMPDAIKFLGQYDTWRKEEVGPERWNDEILAFQFGMRMICNSAESFPATLLNEDDEKYHDLMVDTLNTGLTVLKYQQQVNKTQCKKSFPFLWNGLRCICLNGGGFNSDVFKSVYDPEKYDIMMPFQFNGTFWTFSLYSDKEHIDCSALAKQMGGGGHKGAAGFQVSDIKEVFQSFPIIYNS